MNSEHLIHDELLVAVVDAADLAAEKRAHLAACPVCTNARARLEERFVRLGRMAHKMAPAPARPFRLPTETSAASGFRFKPLWVMGLAAAMLLAMLMGRSLGPDFWRGPVPVPTAAMLEEDRRLTEAVDALVEDALPPAFQHLASLDEEDIQVSPDIDDDLLDWVVPPIEENNDASTLKG